MSSDSIHDKLRTGAGWVVGSRIVGIGATLAANILAARLLGPSEFGTFLFLTTVIAFGSILAMAGLNEAGLRFASETLALGDVALARRYLRQSIAVVCVASAAATLLTAGSIAFYEMRSGSLTRALPIAAVVGLGVLALAWQQLAAESLRGWQDLRLASLFSGGQSGGPISNVLFLTALGAMAVLTQRLTAITTVGLSVAAVWITLPVVWTCVRRVTATAGPLELRSDSPPPPVHSVEAPAKVAQPQSMWQLASVGLALMLIQLLAFGSQQFDIWIGDAVLEEESLGLYGAAKRCLLISAMPVQMAMLSVVSSIAHLHARGERKQLERVLRTSAGLAAMPSLAALALLVAMPETVLRLIFGGSYSGAAPIVLMLAAGHLVLVLSGNPIHTLAMTGHHRLALVVNLLAAIVLVAAGAIGARMYGAMGLAAASAASLATQNILLWWLAHRYVGVWTHAAIPVWPFQRRQIAPESGPAITMNET